MQHIIPTIEDPMTTMRLTLLIGSAGLLVSPWACATQHAYRDKAVITVSAGRLRATADAPRPLNQVLVTVGELFGWTVSYEDPIYSKDETIDAAVDDWRRQHPNEKGLLVPSGGLFEADVAAATEHNAQESVTIENIVQQYNKSSNPGTFFLKKTALGRMVVVGQSGKQGSAMPTILDREFKADAQAKNGLAALEDFTSRCSGLQGTPITVGVIPVNALSHASVPGETKGISCRNRLDIVLHAVHAVLSYSLLFDPGSESYVLNIVPAHHLIKDENGQKKIVQLPLPKR